MIDSAHKIACGADKRRPATRRVLQSMRKCRVQLAALCAVALQLQLLGAPLARASYYGKAPDGASYDPEQQDGIPVFSARSVSAQAARQGDTWANSGDARDADFALDGKRAQRRQSDSDLDDDADDADDDEFTSGSNLRESVESPAYGESRKSARDGEEIEDFFDKHLGPPKEAPVAAAAAQQAPVGANNDETILQRESVPASDPDDFYEAAASSPLSSIFHSLLGRSNEQKHAAAKLPFLQITATTTSAADNDDVGKTSGAQQPKASQSAQGAVEASPLALAIAQEVGGATAASGDEQSGADEQPGSIRQIYIGRRPTVMSYLQQAQKAKQREQQQASYSAAGSANVWRGADGRPVVYEQEQAGEYAGGAMAPAPSSQVASDDEQTVTYGLSFGGAPASEPDESSSDGADESAAGPSESAPTQADGYVPYNTRYAAASTSARNNYNSNAGGQFGQQPPVGFNYQAAYGAQRAQAAPQQLMLAPQQQQQQYAPQQFQPSGPTRYHRDPSESAANSRFYQLGSSYAGAATGAHR